MGKAPEVVCAEYAPLVFTLPEPTILLNQWQRLHWNKRRQHNHDLAWHVRVALQQAGHQWGKPFQLCRIAVTRVSLNLPDWDGLYGGLKPLLDTLVPYSKRNPHGLGLIADDNPRVIVDLQARPALTKDPKRQRTEVVITPVTDADLGRLYE